MKKILMLCALLASTTSAFAATVDWTNDATHAAYTVDANGSTTAKSSYAIDETPWLYINLPSYSTTSNSQKVNKTYLADKWNFGTRDVVDAALSGDVDTYAATKTVSGSSLDFWISPANWSSVKQAGAWEIYDVYYQFMNGSNAEQSGSFIGNGGIVNFTVTPEPGSMALFGLGAGLLALKRRRKKA